MTGSCVTVQVLVEGYSPRDEPVDDWGVDDKFGRFLGTLADPHGSVTGKGRGWRATVRVDAIGLDVARERALAAVLAKAYRAGLPVQPVVRVEVVREDLSDAELQPGP